MEETNVDKNFRRKKIEKQNLGEKVGEKIQKQKLKIKFGGQKF